MDVVLFIWDQYMIGLDVPRFQDEFLPMVTAIFFILLNTAMKECSSVSTVL